MLAPRGARRGGGRAYGWYGLVGLCVAMVARRSAVRPGGSRILRATLEVFRGGGQYRAPCGHLLARLLAVVLLG